MTLCLHVIRVYVLDMCHYVPKADSLLAVGEVSEHGQPVIED